jgi:hypothetical protein
VPVAPTTWHEVEQLPGRAEKIDTALVDTFVHRHVWEVREAHLVSFPPARP